MTLDHWWGLQPPDGVKDAWGARAIFNPSGPSPIDLLHDRQSSKGDAQPICAWLNGGGFQRLKECVKQANLSLDSNASACFADGPFRVEASPRMSHGYLYIVVYTSPESRR